MNTAEIVRKAIPLVAIPTIVTIVLNIVGEDGIGPLDDGEAIFSVIVLAFLAVLFLQLRLSNNKIRTALIHVGIMAAYGVMILIDKGTSQQSSYFSFSAAQSFAMFFIVHCSISYIVLATKTLTSVYYRSAVPRHTAPKRPVPAPTAPTATAPAPTAQSVPPYQRARNIGMLVLIVIAEMYAVSMIGSSDMDPEISMASGFALMSALNAYFMGAFGKNWKRTFRVHLVMVGLAALAEMYFIYILGTDDYESPNSFVSFLPLITIVYWIFSIIAVGVAMYLNSMSKATKS